MRCITFGMTYFDKKKFMPIKNRHFVKPWGGFWTAPLLTQQENYSAWAQWCSTNDFHVERLANAIVFNMSDSARICRIDSLQDLGALPMQSNFGITYTPDFERIAQEYDAIYLTSKGERETRWTRPYNLYGWDCESVLILNPDIVTEVKHEQFELFSVLDDWEDVTTRIQRKGE